MYSKSRIVWIGESPFFCRQGLDRAARENPWLWNLNVSLNVACFHARFGKVDVFAKERLVIPRRISAAIDDKVCLVFTEEETVNLDQLSVVTLSRAMTISFVASNISLFEMLLIFESKGKLMDVCL